MGFIVNQRIFVPKSRKFKRKDNSYHGCIEVSHSFFFNVTKKKYKRGIGLAIAKVAAKDGANIAILAKTDKPHPKLPGYYLFLKTNMLKNIFFLIRDDIHCSEGN